MLHSLYATISRSKTKVLIMVSVFVRVDKVVIGLMFWNFIGMLLNVFLGYLELVAKNNEIWVGFFYCDFVQMLKVCESNQISFLDEVAAGAQIMELIEQVAVEVWTKVEYVLNHHRGTLWVQEVVYMKFCNSIIGVVFLFDHMRCTLWTGSVEHSPVALFINTIQYWLSFTKSIPIQSL